MIHDDRLRCFLVFDRLARRLLYGENAARRRRIVVRLFSAGKKISRSVIRFEQRIRIFAVRWGETLDDVFF